MKTLVIMMVGSLACFLYFFGLRHFDVLCQLEELICALLLVSYALAGSL